MFESFLDYLSETALWISGVLAVLVWIGWRLLEDHSGPTVHHPPRRRRYR
ncbi:MAG: hypothetical protein KDD53_11590 [Bdellovibrionales bacterium]|nr:hypothetical protein [Bdellovibrionales bacterium]